MNKIFIVEDDKLLTLVTTKMLERLGYEVIGSASEGEEALKNIGELTPDIIMLDHHLKGELTGAEVFNKLRDSKDYTPVIFMSGLNTNLYIDEVHEEGPVEFLVKPLNIGKLQTTLKNVTTTLV